MLGQISLDLEQGEGEAPTHVKFDLVKYDRLGLGRQPMGRAQEGLCQAPAIRPCTAQQEGDIYLIMQWRWLCFQCWPVLVSCYVCAE